MKKKGMVGLVVAGFITFGAIVGGITGTQNSDSIETSTSSISDKIASSTYSVASSESTISKFRII